ncbi:alpha-galactosidase [Pedobacter frigiditerrae]|uniref:alpha-galactosidase n=1 Tax=Pedobacter frigiditerrae TaxID=2530452 RepID=UPI00292E0F89|nr:alpha-galactosidase [Pedobacter frigiditerrae]
MFKLRSKIKIVSLTFLLLTFVYGKIKAQTKTIPIETQNNALVLTANQKDGLKIIYFGKKLANQSEYNNISAMYKGNDYSSMLNNAYTPSGGKNLVEPAISVVHTDGNTSLELQYIKHDLQKIDENVAVLNVTLKDPVYDFTVTLHYKTFFKEDMIEQWSTIQHKEKGNVTLQKFASANLCLKADAYWLNQYHGDWAREMQPEESKLTHGIKTIDSKLGTRANLFQPSVFMVSLNQPATETEGSVFYGALAYSGNFKIDLELDYLDNLRIIAGMNNYASVYTLKADEVFTTPPFLFTLSNQGKGKASRQMQDWARKYKLLDGRGNRLTLLNNWEATYFDFNESKLSSLLKDTKKLGVDLFLLDDGWFANKYPRNNDHTGLGDWQENREKLPNGIASLVKEAEATGVKFGIWLEPEMVSPKSELYEKHPDWVIKQAGRDEFYFRNQLVLDLSNPKVQDFVYNTIDGMLQKNPKLAYIKWDCNAVIYNAYSSYQKNQQHFYIEYVRGLYKILERVRAKYTLPMMLCSGGGGRVDYAALQYFTEFWPSDNTDPLERIFMQWEYSYFYPAISTSNHVTDWGKQPIKFRTDVAMMGKLGFDIVVSKLPEKDLQFCKDAVTLYNGIKSIIWNGDQYRLSNPRTENVASVLYIDSLQNNGVIFNYLVNNRYEEGSKKPIKIAGLATDKKYQIREVNVYPGEKTTIDETKIYSGDFLMNIGLNPNVSAGRASVILKIETVN